MGFDSYPSATVLDGTEKALVKQGGATKGVTVQKIRDYQRHVCLTAPGPLHVMVGTARWYPPQSVVVRSMKGYLGIAPSGAGVIFQLRKNGTVIATETCAAGANISPDRTGIDTTLAVTDYLTMDITQIGTTLAGSDLRVRIALEGV